ncbi:alkene reductase [Pacificimonas flava]|uniref:Alkene reductase n=2 Tax=Pacificimonas TaxID=1960290 RepID=A0A219B3U2_9SPHN|nr:MULTISPECIES: alkene reductase [Pacificimonas]MBZ6377502.1 alkene reductase [Pacificimonas aurantium]OWV32803.1 alkene reductase [Pacificimonas flava]
MSLDPLFQPARFGALELKNRIMMAPLTRGRSSLDGVPTEHKIDYYRQRANAGLIIAEATGINRIGLGWPTAPGLWSDEQVEAWKPVTDAVHGAGGLIVSQLWHMGRLSHSSTMGMQPVSASAIAAKGDAHTPKGKEPYETPREMTLDDIKQTVEDYVAAAANARKAGFDGVQVHGANGYLIDQFLKPNTNHRSDDYGGSVENRVRFLMEVMEAVTGEVGADRTSLRLSPNGMVQDSYDPRPERVFGEAARQLSELGLAFLELRESRPDSSFVRSDDPPMGPLIRVLFDGPLVLNEDYSAESAAATIAAGKADAIAFGRPYISNPDLADRFRNGWPLADSNIRTWYSPGPEGYTDYPAYDGTESAAA